MKKFVLLLTLLLLSTSVFAVESPWDKKLPFKEATIYYQIDGMQKGSSTTYIKDYGKKTAVYRDTSMNFLGMTKNSKTLEITTPDWIYNIDLIKKTGTKQANPVKYMKEEYYRLSKSDQKKLVKNSEKLGLSMLGNLNGKVEKKAAKILGYNCDKITMGGMTVYTISNTPLTLKSDGNMMGMKFTETAIKIVKGSVPSSKFKIPGDISIRHDEQADEMIKQQAKATVHNLLEGKAPEPVMKNSNSGSQQQNEMTPEQKDAVNKFMKLFGGKKD